MTSSDSIEPRQATPVNKDKRLPAFLPTTSFLKYPGSVVHGPTVKPTSIHRMRSTSWPMRHSEMTKLARRRISFRESCEVPDHAFLPEGPGRSPQGSVKATPHMPKSDRIQMARPSKVQKVD